MAFVLQLALRGRNVELGYALGRTHGDQARLREVKRVLEVEAASYETPQRVEVVARTLLGMQPPSADRIVSVAGPTVAPPAPSSSVRPERGLPASAASGPVLAGGRER
jgi:hypothetical protein